MEWMSLNDLRESFLSFFESKGHLRLGSFSLVPNNDKSLLLINSGMAPMKKYFTGEVTPPRNRVCTCQKCIRTPDLERVGHTARHGTYFEMLGNFSFGDYFKKEAIPWAWEYLTRVLKIPEELLWPSVYEEDDEAYAIWRDEIGVPEERIVRLGKEDNFWEHGTGPCGPCSEIYFDRGEKYGCGKDTCKPGCDCDRYMEIWNNVFSQFNNMGDGTYTELEHKNIDTGMGLERLACVMQGVDNMFEVDTIRNILDKVCEISGKTYGKTHETDVSIRAITDHARAATFMISDGIIPSNEGRGYVLRRLIRRAARHGRLIGIERPFLTELADAVIGENRAGYPELDEKQELIKKVIQNEEASFLKTIDSGLSMLESLTKNTDTLSAADAFKLYDTYGFPLDLTKDILSEKGIGLDEEGFNALMQRQREQARASRKAADKESWNSGEITFECEKTVFSGYTEETCAATVLDIVVEGEHVSSAEKGQHAIIVLDKTVFYGESGGQTGDTGVIKSSDAEFCVTDTKKNSSGVFMHIGFMKEGSVTVGDSVTAEYDYARRQAIRRNHTAAHLLQAALRKVLGNHVEQAGQFVTDKSCRFDFTHFAALTENEIKAVEDIVNGAILSGIAVKSEEMPIEKAKTLGAMALFGEKYGDIVRVVTAGDISVEFCGGTHIDNAAKIGLFKILSESGIAAGVRRIEAVTGNGVLSLLEEFKSAAFETAGVLKCGKVEELPQKAAAVAGQVKELQKKIEKLENKLNSGKTGDVMKSAVDIDGVLVATARFDGTSPDELRKMTDTVRADNETAVAVFAAVNGDKLTFCAGCGKAAIERGAHAGNIVKAVASIAGGNGGGKPDSAMAGGREVAKTDEALKGAVDIIKEMIK